MASNIVTSGYLDSDIRPSALVTYRLEETAAVVIGGLTWDQATSTWDQTTTTWSQA